MSYLNSLGLGVAFSAEDVHEAIVGRGFNPGAVIVVPIHPRTGLPLAPRPQHAPCAYTVEIRRPK